MPSDKADSFEQTPESRGTDSAQTLVCQVLEEMKADLLSHKGQDKAPQSALDDNGALNFTPIFPGDTGFTPKLDPGSRLPDVGDSGFTPKLDPGSKLPDIGDPGFTPKLEPVSKVPDVGDPGFTPKLEPVSKVPDLGDPGFTPKLEPVSKVPDLGDPGFTPRLEPISKGPDVLDPGFAPWRSGTDSPAGTLKGLDRDTSAFEASTVELGREAQAEKTSVPGKWIKPDAVQYDANGDQKGLIFDDKYGNHIELEIKDKNIVGGKITNSEGREGAIKEVNGKLVYGDDNRIADYEYDGANKRIKTREIGTYDADTGTITKHEDGNVEKVSLAPGRLEVTTPDGNIATTTDRGDYGLIIKSTGDTMVSHSDHTGVVMHKDGSIDMWKENQHVKDKLSSQEQQYLKKHPDVDPRDMAEIHRRFYPDHKQIEKFYDSLNKIDSAKNLGDSEKSSLRKELMHHVAAPAEIYQGATESCNVSVIQRDLALMHPEKYVDIVRSAISDGVVKTPQGDVHVDPVNLRQSDSSGRDIASRIFQTAALHAAFAPEKNFVNTPDGVGRLLPGDSKHNQGAKDEAGVAFTGLFPSELAEARYKMTGEEKMVSIMKSQADLDAAIKENHYPMTISVDSSGDPFNKMPQADHRPNHVVTIVGELDNPKRYLIQNQWGLADDHSSPDSAVPADVLIKNMKGPNGDGSGQAYIPGKHGSVLENGKIDSGYLKFQKNKRYEIELGSGH